MAIEHSLVVLSWHENLQKEEIPPEHLWEDIEGLEMWWATVEEKRDGGVTASRSEDIAVADGDGHRDQGMAENDYARSLKN